jgi:hypothetical protein
MWRLILIIIIALLLFATVKRSRGSIEHFQDAAPVPLATPIPGFVIPPSVVPKKPPPSANSNGGLVSIG